MEARLSRGKKQGLTPVFLLMQLIIGTNCKRRKTMFISFVIDIQTQFLNSLA